MPSISDALFALRNLSTFYFCTLTHFLDNSPYILRAFAQQDEYLGDVIIARFVHWRMRCSHHERVQTRHRVGNVESFGIGLGQTLNVFEIEPLISAGLVER